MGNLLSPVLQMAFPYANKHLLSEGLALKGCESCQVIYNHGMAGKCSGQAPKVPHRKKLHGKRKESPKRENKNGKKTPTPLFIGPHSIANF
jgi:hypothetical protein